MRFVLDLDPAFRWAGPIGQIDAFANDAFEPKVAGVLEDHRAVALKMFDVCDAAPCSPQVPARAASTSGELSVGFLCDPVHRAYQQTSGRLNPGGLR